VFSAPPTEPVLPIVVEQTNLYAVQVGSSFVTNEKEMEEYIGALIRMGIVHKPRYDMYTGASSYDIHL